MIIRKNFLVTIALLSAVVLGTAATSPAPDEKHEGYKNLKVLPKNITEDQMKEVMKGWSKALGVKCNHCHVQQKDDPKKLDFPNDAKPEKDMARSMYKMTMKINKKYFGHEKHEGEKAVMEVSCNTCHRGHDEPEK
ncbi:c-type cytochrome [Rubrolithibacter danxiaensis]|uniref:c-type cytochrome n=1 Tax=Rubrolithibacter danxiaensis TaxID=3390805 RepID=UPI003BF7EA4D